MMEKELKIAIYGDSILRATVPDEAFRYHFHGNDFLAAVKGLPVKIVNRAKFGATVERGRAVMEADLQKAEHYDYALLEYGGNDCNFHWDQISEAPEEEHLPYTGLKEYLDTLEDMIDRLQAAGTQPAVMTLPPIDSAKYLDFLCRDGLKKENILHWLGDENMIYRYQELYSDQLTKLALRRNLPIIDVRSMFLEKHDFYKLISADGIHLTLEGYQMLFDKLKQTLTGRVLARA